MKNSYPLQNFINFIVFKTSFCTLTKSEVSELMHMCYINAFEALINHSRMCPIYLPTWSSLQHYGPILQRSRSGYTLHKVRENRKIPQHLYQYLGLPSISFSCKSLDFYQDS